ncbi:MULTISPECIES: DoxX family protein [unclassified Neorhizobium]|uniref:DoxX family protein n=1 Tax=unclassified Neorhizobium TaxID=2629175 RepID=UPI001FF65F17|nr:MULTISPECIES: DoxX family protein [unclassified Neorhizobium]MCJ9669519.1 DoxX family protein [Neorhizobium sp. SHOUNA12B]MCJ9745173.1 DoxX family protein [Neorhizobium sp. SHOUNA12A]
MVEHVVFENAKDELVIPALAPVYEKLAQPMAWSIFRLAVGGMLVIEGWPKIIAPLAQVGFVENIGMYPGWFWSPFLAALQFFGGMFIAAGLFTRPVALANGVMLAMTLWFHVTHPYGDAFLTPAGIEALKAGGQQLFTPQALARLKDGGHIFLEQVQSKAELASLFWTGGAFLYAAFGGGYLSLDRLLFRKHF